MILKVDIFSFALGLVQLFRNRLPYQFLLNSFGSTFHPEPYGMRKKLRELLLLVFQRRNYAYFSTDSGFHFYRVDKERARTYRPFATRVLKSQTS
ncbi:hypothetical protein TSAR_008578 [Trichomalopsis sarcophagae]|uniref:Uncharacterized protein n=1 Tax=Trichomalopsis sarcophagae TaxID=543379 RepID=A0A232FBY1_9HYME|nr:hypothetical protein TSAR_008578 [Trichomalopsis sarcophagae]